MRNLSKSKITNSSEDVWREVKEVCTVVRLLLFYRSVNNNLTIDFGKLKVHKYSF